MLEETRTMTVDQLIPFRHITEEPVTYPLHLNCSQKLEH